MSANLRGDGLSQTSSASPRRRPALYCAAGLLLIGVIASLPMGMTAPQQKYVKGSFLTVPVERGTLEVKLSQRGLLDSAKNLVVASECEWSTRIIGLIPEGTQVEQGDIVVELDSSELTERLKEREILLIDAEADLIQAKEILAMQQLENESALAKAKLKLRLAQLDLQKYRQGEFPKSEKESKGAVALAKEDYSRSKERLEFVSRMARKGYESPMAVERERIQLMKYENKLTNAQAQLDVLTQHTKNRTLTELEAAAEHAQSSLERVAQIAKIAVLNRQVQVHTRQRKFDGYTEYVERLQKSIAACTIRAPMSGEIIYANEGTIRNEILEGEHIRNRQDVVRMPDMRSMDVKLRIHESQIEGIRKGLPVRIRLDAYPELQLTGHVETVSRVPTAGKDYNFDLKQYDATVRVDANGTELTELKPGLTALVDVLVNRLDDCMSIPAQSVVTVAGRPVVFVETANGIEHREIKVGISNETAVQVVAGLTGQEQVLLSPRTTCSQELIALQEQFSGSETDVSNIGG